MNPSYGLILFGVAFCIFAMIVITVQARRKKDKTGYFVALIPFFMLLVFVFIVLNQRLLVIIFFASIAVFAYSVYEFSQKKALGASVWYWVTGGLVALTLILIGAVSTNVVTIFFGIFLLLSTASSFLTSYVRSDRIVKRALEVVFLFMAFGVIVYGYAITGSLSLGVITLFIATMFFVAFALSYLLPKIRGNRE